MTGTSSYLGRVSLFFPIMPARADTIEGFAEIVRDAGLARLWMGQSLTLDTYHQFAYLAGRGFRLPIGTAVSVMPLRHPYEAAVQARSLALLSGRSVVVGLGPGSPELVASMRGSTYASPLGASREYLSMVHALVNGEAVRHKGEYHALEGMLPPVPAGHPAISVGVGVLRSGMARLAGQVADVAITWLTPWSYIRDTLAPAMREGAEGAGRPLPRIVSLAHFAVSRPGRDPRQIVLAANRNHLSTRHYTAMLRSAGLTADPDDPVRGAEALVDDGTFLSGTAGQIAVQVAHHLRSGVDEVVLSPGGVLVKEGPGAALEDLREVVAAIGAVDG